MKKSTVLSAVLLIISTAGFALADEYSSAKKCNDFIFNTKEVMTIREFDESLLTCNNTLSQKHYATVLKAAITMFIEGHLEAKRQGLDENFIKIREKLINKL